MRRIEILMGYPVSGVGYIGPYSPESTRAIITKEIDAVQRGAILPPIHIPACNAGSQAPREIIHGKFIIADGPAARQIITQIPFITAPAIIDTCRPCRRIANFFTGYLPHIADPHIACQPVKTPAPGISEANRPDFIQGRRVSYKGIICRDGIGQSRYIDPEHFPE